MKQAIVVRTDLEMGKGKMISQGAHASLEAFFETQRRRPEWSELWLAEGQKKIVLKVGSKEALIQLYEEVKKEIPAALIVDAGYTQVKPGTITCLGIGPAPDPLMDKYLSRYKLL